MSTNLIVDTSVFLIYASYDKIYRLANAVEKYNLTLFVNETLLDELENNLPRIIRVKDITIENILTEIKRITTVVIITPTFTQSPDPKDNFLFDLAIQTNSEILVTQEKALLNFENSPVKIHDLKWFKETYPVGL